MLPTLPVLRIINPPLIASDTMTGVKDDISPTVIQTMLISTDFTILGPEPVLITTLKN